MVLVVAVSLVDVSSSLAQLLVVFVINLLVIFLFSLLAAWLAGELYT